MIHRRVRGLLCEPNNQLNVLYHFRNGRCGCARKTSLSPQLFITDRSTAVVLFWFSVAGLGIRDSVTFHLTCVHITFSSVWAAAPSVDHMFSLYCNFSYFRFSFGFEGWIWIP